MLKAVALSGIDSTTGEPSAEPESLAIKIPDMESHKDFLDDLDERLKTLESIRDLFSAQAKRAEEEANQINKIGLSFQALSSIDFNDTY